MAAIKKKVKVSLTVSQLSLCRENYFHPLSRHTDVTTEIRRRHAGAYVVRQGTWYSTYCLLLSLSIAHSTRRNWITASFTEQAYRKFDEGFLQSWEASPYLVVANTLWRRHAQQYQILRQLPSWHKCQISRTMPIPLRVGNHMKILCIRFGNSVYRVIQEGRSLFWVMVVSVTVRKNSYEHVTNSEW